MNFPNHVVILFYLNASGELCSAP